MTNLQISIRRYEKRFREQMLTLWEKSVSATHDFLSPKDFNSIKSTVRSIDFRALDVYCLIIKGSVIGFVGVAERKIEMLFLDPSYFGRGLGKELVNFAITKLKADKVDVNEQNSSSVRFYGKLGFETYERTEKDDQGNDYPLLRMKLRIQETEGWPTNLY